MPERIEFSAEAIADIRRKYLESDETVNSILQEYGISDGVLKRLRMEHRWPKRTKRSDVPPGTRLLMEADKAVQDHIEGVGDASPLSIADRLEKAVEKELASLEMRRANLGVAAADPSDAERATRTIQRLSETLYKIQRLRVPEVIVTDPTPAGDRPKDTDEFRRRLKRRIEALRNEAGEETPSENPNGGAAST